MAADFANPIRPIKQQIRLSQAERDRLDREARRLGTEQERKLSRADVIRQALEDYFSQAGTAPEVEG